MGTLRGVAAALAACLVLSGCGAGQADDQATTTSPTTVDAPSNPWDLPIEQRPALFDPCAEIPVEAVEQGVGGPVEEVFDFANHTPTGLISCGWKNEEVQLSVLSTWKSRNEYIADDSFKVEGNSARVGDRNGLRISDRDDSLGSSCIQLFFTSHGTVWLRLDLVTGLNEFKGSKLNRACDVIDDVISPIVGEVPEGDF